MNSGNLILGPGYLTWNTGNFRFGEGGIKVKFLKNYREVSTEEFGRIDTTQTDRRIEVTGKLWSGFENLALLFPASMLTPTIGAKLFGIVDKPVTINGQDGSRLLLPRGMVTEFTNLHLGVDAELWSGEVKFTCLLATDSLPTDAAAYYTESEANSYTAPTFTKTNFLAPHVTAAWGTRTGMTAMVFRKGLEISGKYDLNFEQCYVDGLGTLDCIVNGFEGSAKGMPIGPTLAQVLSNSGMGSAFGALQSAANTDNLVITATGLAITLYAAFLSENDGLAWARQNHRIGDLTWRTTVPFTAGAPTARMAVGTS